MKFVSIKPYRASTKIDVSLRAIEKMAEDWMVDAEQAILITMKKLIASGSRMDIQTVREAAVKALVDMARDALTESDAWREIRTARDRLVAKGDIDAPLKREDRWRLLRQ